MPLRILSWACLPSLLLLQLLVLSGNVINAGEVVIELPGFTGPLPFKLQTGYISLNESNLSYLFVESQGDPTIDPIIIYLIGGPGCSALNSFMFQTGPVLFNVSHYEGGLPKLFLNEFTWTKTASIIFPDIIPGTGYSYSSNAEDYYMSDSLFAKGTILFMRKWFEQYPEFITKQFYIATDSYSGVYAPVIAQQILQENEDGVLPLINIRGIISGSAHTRTYPESNSVIPFAYRMALIPQSLYESAESSCNGNYVNVDPSNAGCLEALAAIQQCTDALNTANILEPNCALLAPNPKDYKGDGAAPRILRKILRNSNLEPLGKEYWCRNFVYFLVDVWANDKSVRGALHVREGTIKEWVRCNLTLIALNYGYDTKDALPYHKNLTNTAVQLLIYGDQVTLLQSICRKLPIKCSHDGYTTIPYEKINVPKYLF